MLAIIVLVICMLIYAAVFKLIERIDRSKAKRDNEKHLEKWNKHD